LLLTAADSGRSQPLEETVNDHLSFDGWHLIGAFPDHEPNDVGSWILHHGGEGLLLEVPEGLRIRDVRKVIADLGVTLRYVTASHSHLDHLDTDAWKALKTNFSNAVFVHPSEVRGDKRLQLNGEPVWLVKGPKHSPDDVVTVFRGVAMTGDIELGTVESVNDEVSLAVRHRSMKRLAEFSARRNYRVHSTVSAHLNDVRRGVDWSSLFQGPGLVGYNRQQ
jgi:hypothetical protein